MNDGIVCEETRIRQVFQNLLDNAIKYMDKPQGQMKIGQGSTFCFTLPKLKQGINNAKLQASVAG